MPVASLLVILYYTDELLRVAGGLHDVSEVFEIIGNSRGLQASFEAVDFKGFEAEAFAGNELFLHAALGAAEDDFASLTAGAYVFCDGKRGIDMTARAAASEKHFHKLSQPFLEAGI